MKYIAVITIVTCAMVLLLRAITQSALYWYKSMKMLATERAKERKSSTENIRCHWQLSTSSVISFIRSRLERKKG